MGTEGPLTGNGQEGRYRLLTGDRQDRPLTRNGQVDRDRTSRGDGTGGQIWTADRRWNSWARKGMLTRDKTGGQRWTADRR